MAREKERVRLVVDSNIIFSLIIKGKSSVYLDIFSNDDLEMYAPENILYEFKKYEKELKNRSEEFEETVFIVFSLVRIIPQEFYLDKMEKAQNICRRFDEKIHHLLG
jgi:predicted nucleic acid-binding protein